MDKSRIEITSRFVIAGASMGNGACVAIARARSASRTGVAVRDSVNEERATMFASAAVVQTLGTTLGRSVRQA